MNYHLRIFLLPVLFAFVLLSCGEKEAGYDQITILKSADPQWEGARYPDIALAPDGKAYISFIKDLDSTQTGLYVQELSASGEQSAPAVLVASGDDWFVNWADFPTLAVTGEQMLASWLQKSGGGDYDYDIQIARSTDRGASWSEGQKLHDDTVKAEHGFLTLAGKEDGGIQAVWLDGRNSKGTGHEGHSGHGGHGGGAMSLRTATISPDGSIAASILIDDRVCDCCQTDIVMAGDRPVIAYRDRREPEIRDLALATYVDSHWVAGLRLGEDNWDIAACPVNGPAIDVQGDQVLTARFTGAGGDARVLVNTMSLSTQEQTASIRMDDAAPAGRVDVAWLAEGRAVVIWVEQVKAGGVLMMAVIDTDAGEIVHKEQIADYDPSRRSGFPRMKLWNGALYLLYTETKEVQGRNQIVMQRVILS